MHILEASAALKLIRTRTVTELILKNKKQHASSTFPDAVALEPLRNFSLRREPSKDTRNGLPSGIVIFSATSSKIHDSNCNSGLSQHTLLGCHSNGSGLKGL